MCLDSVPTTFGAPVPSPEGRRQRVLDAAAAIGSVEGMEATLRGMGSPEEAIVESLAHNDTAALSATIVGIADWEPSAADVQAPSLWYQGSEDRPFSSEDVELAARLGVEIDLIPGADNVASFRRADDVLAIVRPFLEKHQ